MKHKLNQTCESGQTCFRVLYYERCTRGLSVYIVNWGVYSLVEEHVCNDAQMKHKLNQTCESDQTLL